MRGATINGSALEAMKRRLGAGETILMDGATGSELERRGAEMVDAAWCSMATLTHPEILAAVHQDYIRAGAKLITTNTFSTNRNMLGPAGLGDALEKVNRAAVDVARSARASLGANDVVIAGSMSHQVPMDASRRRFIPSEAQARANFREMADILAGAGVDLLLLEMMCDPSLANLALDAARATGLPVWVGFSARADAQGDPESYLVSGLSVAGMLEAIDFRDAQVAGIMHSKSNVIGPALEVLKSTWTGPLMAYPDSGYFKKPNWQFVDVIAPDDFVQHCQAWRAAGAQLLGGCCGLGLEHIDALAHSL